MYRSFFGLTAVNLVMNKINSKQLKDTLLSHPSYVTSLRDDFLCLKNFLDNYPTSYDSIQGKRKSIELRMTKDESKRKEIEEFLSTQSLVPSHSVSFEGKSHNLSDDAYAVVRFLISSKSRIDKICEMLKEEDLVPSGGIVNVLGRPLHTLTQCKETSLTNLLHTNLKDLRNRSKVALLTKTYRQLEKASSEEQSGSPTGQVIDFSVLRSNLSVEGINNIIGFKSFLDYEDLYNLGLELIGIGLVGFNVQVESFYEDFKSTEFDSAPVGIRLSECLHDLQSDLKEILECSEEVLK